MKFLIIEFSKKTIFLVEAQNSCTPNPCQNSGFCFFNTTTFTIGCQCPASYRGAFCERPGKMLESFNFKKFCPSLKCLIDIYCLVTI